MLSSVLLVSLLLSTFTPVVVIPRATVSDTPIAALCGVVTDRFGHPLAGAEVRLTNPATGEVVMTKSDESGRYQFRAADTSVDYTLSVRRIGFAPQTVPGMHLGPAGGSAISFELDSVKVNLHAAKSK